MDGPAGSETLPAPNAAPLRPEGRPRARVVLAVLLVATAALWLTRYTDRPLTGDSVRYAAIARGMLETGDWVEPRTRGEPDWWKPPLGYWLAASSMAVFGPTPFAAMLPSILAGVLLLLVLFLVIERLAGALAGVVSVLVLLFLPSFVQHTASLRLESVLQLFGLLALVAVHKARERPLWFLAFWGLVGASILTKNVAGLLPLVVLGLTALVTRRAFPLDRRAFWACLPAALVVAAPWYAVMTLRHGGEFWATHLGREVGHRVTGSRLGGIAETAASAFRFLGFLGPLAILGGFFALRDARRDPRLSRYAAMGGVWVGFVLLTQVVNLLPIARYLYNAFVPLAAFAGYGIARLVGRRAPSFAPLAVAAAALAVAVGVRVFEPPPGERETALRALLDTIESDSGPVPLLAVATDPDQPETFVWFHLHRHTEPLLPSDLPTARASRPEAFRGRLAILDDGARESVDVTTFEVVRKTSLYWLVRLR